MPKTEIPQLTGLRFMAAFSILFMHTVTWCIPFNDTDTPRAIAGWFGVYGMPLFFVLSGFVIHYNYALVFRSLPYATAALTFFGARFARIYPLYFFFMLVGAVSDFTANWIGYAPREFLDYALHSATLTQSWIYKIAIHDRLVLDHGFGLAWSLSSEFFFYLAFAVFVFAILRIRRPVASLASLAAFSFVVAGILFVAYFNVATIMALAKEHVPGFLSTEESATSSFYRWLFYFSPYVRVWEFALGCLTAQLFMIVQYRPVTACEQAFATVALITALAFLVAFGGVYAFSLGPQEIIGLSHFFALNFGCAIPIGILIFYVSRYKNTFSNAFALPSIVWLGEISYSIYAVHTWTLRPFIRPPISFNTVYAVDAILRVALGIGFTLIVSTATYKLIEQPCRRYLRARLMTKK